jgi:hypothetical protein
MYTPSVYSLSIAVLFLYHSKRKNRINKMTSVDFMQSYICIEQAHLFRIKSTELRMRCVTENEEQKDIINVEDKEIVI